MAILLRGETMLENAGQVFRGDAHAVVGNGNPDAMAAVLMDADGQITRGDLTEHLSRFGQKLHSRVFLLFDFLR